MKSKAVIAGSFDPITFGHLWVIAEGLKMFDTIDILIAVNPAKKGMFTAVQREMLVLSSMFPIDVKMPEAREAARANGVEVEVLLPEDTTVGYAKTRGATHIIRGIRNTTDFEYEHQLNLINSKIAPEIRTIYLMPPRELIEVSSSTVKSLVGLNGWEKMVEGYVPPIVMKALQAKQVAV